jgi:Tfp pilus assembly ATPase PilU
LLPRHDNPGRTAAVEILINTPLIADKILKGEVGDIKDVMKKSRELGMQTFDQALFDLYEDGKISYEEALRNADSLNDLRLQIKLNSKRGVTGTPMATSNSPTCGQSNSPSAGRVDYASAVVLRAMRAAASLSL